MFKATFGLLVNKARDKVAEKLKEGNVADKRIREIIQREIDDIKSKLDGLARNALLAAIDAFEAGVKYLYQAVDADAVVGHRSIETTTLLEIAFLLTEMAQNLISLNNST